MSYQEMIFFTIQDPSAFKGCMEVISSICQQSEAYIFFYKAGILLEACSSDGKLRSRHLLLSTELQEYKYEVVNDQGDKVEPYVIKYNPKIFYMTIKGDSKKSSQDFVICIDPETMMNRGIDLYDDKNHTLAGFTVIKVGAEMERVEPDQDYHTEHYEDEVPCVKLLAEDFVKKIIGKYYDVSCNSVTLVLTPSEDIITIGSKDNNKISTMRISGGGDSLVDIQDDESQNYHKITLPLKDKIRDWKSKLSRLSTRGIIKIYMKQEAPLVMITPIGNFGTSTFVFFND